MCPYFWSFVGTLFILPFIALARACKIPSKSIGTFITRQLTACKEYSERRSSKRAAIQYEKDRIKRKVKLEKVIPSYNAFLTDPCLTTAKVFIYNVNKYCKNSDTFRSRYLEFYYPNTEWTVQQKLNGEIYRNVESADDLIANDRRKLADINLAKSKERKIAIQTTIKETKENPIVKYILLGMMFFAAGMLVISVLAAIWWIFTVLILPYVKWIILVLVAIGILASIITCIVWFFRCWGETIGNFIGDIGDSIGEFILAVGKCLGRFFGRFKPLVKVFLIFIWIKDGFKIIVGTVQALYEKHCPLITWVNPEKQ